MKRICIVGIGWLGEELAIDLRKWGYYIIGTSSSFAKKGKAGVNEFRVFNLENQELYGAIDCDVLIYTIPPSSSEYYARLSIGFLSKMLEMNVNLKIIYTSSTSIYGNIEREVDELSDINPESLAAQKIAKVELFIKENFQNSAIFRLGGLVGGSRHPVKFLSGRSGVSKPLAPVNLLHREDAVGAISHLLRNFEPGTYNLCSENHPLKNVFYNTLAERNGLKAIDFDFSDKSGDKVVTCNAIKKKGFEFKYSSPYDFPFEN